jgi:hypothetical protein
MPNPETELRQTERLLQELLAEAKAVEDAESSRLNLLNGLFSKAPERAKPLDKKASSSSKVAAKPVIESKVTIERKKRDRRSDFVVAGFGIALGLACALFPWYILFNRPQIVAHGLSLGGHGRNSGRTSVTPSIGPLRPTSLAQQSPISDLDMFPTATVAQQPESPNDAPGLDQQPFPDGKPSFHLIQVANGRAMIGDDSGLWIVQRGSRLPDSSVVSSIEQRDGKWVVVTNTDQVLQISK